MSGAALGGPAVPADAAPDPELPGSRKWGPYGRRPLVVLCLIGLVDAVDRGVLPGVITLVQDDLGITDFQAGLLSSAIVIATLLVAVPGGLLADRKDRRTLMALVLCLWSAATALSAVVRSFPQLFAVRSLLGVGDAINDPAAQSLVADYYPAEVRGRAYGWQRVVPTAGVAVGAVIGGVLGEAFGWRVAVLAVALPGVVVAVLVKRLPLPERGASDRPLSRPSVVATGSPPPLLPSQASPVLAPLTTRQSLRACLAVPSLRALLFATSITTASLAALGFWGIAYHERASGLSASRAAAVAGGAILLGAIVGGFGGGVAADRLRGRVHGSALLLGAVTTATGTLVVMLSFNDGIPVFTVRLPLQVVGVALIVAALPALTAMTTEVVKPHLRGTAFGLLKMSANLFSALTPPLIGLIADTQRIQVGGEEKGDLGFAFRWTVWAVLLGSALLLYGRRHVEDDLRAASEPAVVPAVGTAGDPGRD